MSKEYCRLRVGPGRSGALVPRIVNLMEKIIFLTVFLDMMIDIAVHFVTVKQICIA